MKPVLKLAACMALIAAEPALAGDKGFFGGRIYTMDPSRPWAEAMVLKGDRIEFVGSAAEARGKLDEGAETIDLQGRFVTPGIVDAHNHIGLSTIFGGSMDQAGESEDVPELTTREQVLEYLARVAGESREPFIFLLQAFPITVFPPEGPTAAELDRIVPDRPAVIQDDTGHVYWMNSLAMQALGIDRDTPDVSPGISSFARDKDGNPTGIAREMALLPLLGDSLVADEDTVKELMSDVLGYLNSRGVTAVYDAGNVVWSDLAYGALARLEREGRLHTRIEGSYHVWRPDRLDGAAEGVLALRRKYGGALLRFNTVKIHYDGTNEIHTGGVLEPYEGTDSTGAVLYSTEDIERLMLDLSGHGINLHVHVVGDRAARNILDAMDRAEAALGRRLPITVTLAHLELVAPEDIARFKRPNLFANFTPQWFRWAERYNLQPTLGKARSGRSMPAGSFQRAGATVTFGADVISISDVLSMDPLLNIQAAVTRQNPDHGPSGPIMSGAHERMTRADAIAAYTLNAARQLGLGDRIGSLSAGKQADFVVYDRNIFDADVYGIRSIDPVAVFRNGAAIYSSY